MRLVTADDPVQAAAKTVVENAEFVAISVSSLCELVWVLRSIYATPRDDIADAVKLLIGADHVVTNRPAVEEGLRMLRTGGDFADGVIAQEGRALGGETFHSFDEAAVKRLRAEGRAAELLQ